ncbi:hypothetical protein ARMSODRAFT_122702 [Armillaria solidipes]|uniref:Uncharacterized protein n=1 Tax=Armillaria solidipes TaxID=1076256 RepID=A0A2H3BST3_9AGAR|nr:hypothetical protein ARMSODRAFT_122702 [Armillaria solidipes]
MRRPTKETKNCPSGYRLCADLKVSWSNHLYTGIIISPSVFYCGMCNSLLWFLSTITIISFSRIWQLKRPSRLTVLLNSLCSEFSTDAQLVYREHHHPDSHLVYKLSSMLV